MESGLETKRSLSLVIVGHVDTGKSTILGHLLLKLGLVSDRNYARNVQDAQDIGKGSFCHAFVMDKTRAERERGISIDSNFVNLESPNAKIHFFDTPGHRNFLKNAITNIALADYMVFCVSAAMGEFEISIADDGNSSVRRLSTIGFTFGLKSLIVVVNKMDAVQYSQQRFDEVQQETIKMLNKVGWKNEQITFIPISGWYGANLVQNDDKMKWWQGQTLLQAIHNLQPLEMNLERPLRIILKDDFKIKGVGKVLVGKVLCGVLSVGDSVVISAQNNVSATVFSLEHQYKLVEKAYPGDVVGMNIKNYGSSMNIRFPRGTVIGSISLPPVCNKKFTADIVMVSKIPWEIKVGYSPLIDCGTGHVPCLMSKIIYSTNLKGEEKIEDPKSIKYGRRAQVEFEPKLPLVVEQYTFIPSLGRFVVRDNDIIVAIGKVTGTETVGVGRITKAAIRKD